MDRVDWIIRSDLEKKTLNFFCCFVVVRGEIPGSFVGAAHHSRKQRNSGSAFPLVIFWLATFVRVGKSRKSRKK